MNKVAIIGAGNGGYAMAADLTLAGFQVNLFEFEEYKQNIAGILQHKTITIEGNARVGQVTLNMVTTNIEQAVLGVDTIFVATHSASHAPIAESLAPILEDGQSIFYFTGNLGSLYLYNKIKDTKKNVLIAEVITLPYAVRKVNDDTVYVHRRTGDLGLSAMPAKHSAKALAIFQEYYPDSHVLYNILEGAICNSNATAHILPMLMSISSIEKANGNYNFYKDAYSPCVNRAIDALDKELGFLLKSFACTETSSLDVVEKRFSMTQAEILEMRSAWNIPAKIDKNMRFISEDVQECLILISTLGTKYNLPTPIVNSLICLFSTLVENQDFYKTGRTMEKLSITQKTIE